MNLTGERWIALPRDRLWEALNDPDILRRSIPGCETVERTTENEFTMAMVAAVGPVKARFTGRLVVTDPVPPESYALSFEGSGGIAGFGRGIATVRLSDEADGTRLHYTASAVVGGRIAQIGARLVDGVARRLAEAFFQRFDDAVSTDA